MIFPAAKPGRSTARKFLKRGSLINSDIEPNEIGILKRREIEARLLAPIVDALGRKFGRQEVLEEVRKVITKIGGRDASFIEGFNEEIVLERKHTILQGAASAIASGRMHNGQPGRFTTRQSNLTPRQGRWIPSTREENSRFD